MDEILEQLERYLNSTPQDVLERDWKKKEYLNEIGPDITEYVQYVHENYKYDMVDSPVLEYNFKDMPINACSKYFKVA